MTAGAEITVGALLERTQARLAAVQAEDAHLEAGELVAHALGTLPAQLPARAAAAATQDVQGRLEALVARRLADEPTGYIVGAVQLDGMRFKVDRRGFIPRFDLTNLIAAALQYTPEGAQGWALDLACGIGAAGIGIAAARPGFHVDLADVSAEALELARENADRIVPGRARVFAGDLFAALPQDRRGEYAIIAANPPWVPDGTALPSEVIDHEPRVSFFGGPDGLDIVRRLIAQLPAWLAPGGTYAQECDPSQIDKVLALLAAQGLRDGRAHQDREGVRRVVSARRPA